MPYLVRLLLARRVAEWQARLDRLGAYLLGELPAEPAVKSTAPQKKT